MENLAIRRNKLDIGVKVVFLRNKPVEVENNTIAQNKPDKPGFQLRIQVKNSSEWFISQFGRSINCYNYFKNASLLLMDGSAISFLFK